MKITNICAIPHGTGKADAAKILSDCGLPDKMISALDNKTVNLSDMVSLGTYNSRYAGKKATSYLYDDIFIEQFDTNAAAFETVNGESILVHYNPNCMSDFSNYDYRLTISDICANFIYDLNGKKGPNTVGKDIGIISAFYPVDSVVVGIPSTPKFTYVSGTTNFSAIVSKCKSFGDDFRITSIDELSAILFNKVLIKSDLTGHFFSGSTEMVSGNVMMYTQGAGSERTLVNKNTSLSQPMFFCIKR